jgi:hypothetical protein
MPSPSAERLQHFSTPQEQHAMKKIWFALIFFVGGFAHELRNPLTCRCISSRPAVVWRSGRDER